MGTVEAQIPVLVADDQPIFRAGLAREIRLDRELRVVAELPSGRPAMEAIRRLVPAVALLEARPAGLDERAALRAIAREASETRVILLSADVRQDVAFAALAAGAGGYLSKGVEGDVIRRAIKRVAAGESALCDRVQTLVTDEIRLRHRDDGELLSRREHEVLTLIARGLNTTQIGRRLNLSPATVRGYVAQVYERLGVNERAHAVAVGMRRGLLE